MKTMGCETNTLLPFFAELIEKYADWIEGADHLHAAVTSLVEHVEMLKSCAIQPSREFCQKLLINTLSHLDALDKAGVPFIPKHHFWIHLVRRVHKHGPPFAGATFLDEALNLF